MGIFGYTICDSFSVNGTWWLPLQDEKRLPGTLTFEPGQKLELDLYGAFEEEFKPFSEERKINPSIINGRSIDGVEFTLLWCYRANGKWDLSRGYNQVWYQPKYVLSGGCFDSLDEIRIHECYLGLNLLPEWIGKWSPMSIPTSLPNGGMGMTVELQYENFFTAEVPSINSEISFVETFETSKYSSSFRTVAHDIHSRIRVIPVENKDFSWFLQIAFHIRDAFLLLTSIPFDISAFTFRAVNPNESDHEYFGGEDVQLSLFFLQKVIHDRSPIHPFDYPFSLKKVNHADLSRFFENWFANRSQTEIVFRLFQESVRNHDGNWQVMFLALTQAVETYHRSFRNGQYLDQQRYDEIYSQLVSAIPMETPSDLHLSLKKRLEFGNEYSLRKRIKSLLLELGDDCKALITDDVISFINRVVDTRNYLTHYSADLKAGVLDGADLCNTCLRLRLLIAVCLLKDAGFSEGYIVQHLKSKRHIIGFEYAPVEYSL